MSLPADTDNSTRVPVMCRVDFLQLAALARWFDANGHTPRNRSYLLHMIVSVFHDHLVKNDLIVPIDNIPDAVEALERSGIKWIDGSKGQEIIIEALRAHEVTTEQLLAQGDNKAKSTLESAVLEVLRKFQAPD